MSIVQYRKVKCDECGKIVEIKESSHLPSGWLSIELCEWHGTSGTGRVLEEDIKADIIKTCKEMIKTKEQYPEWDCDNNHGNMDRLVIDSAIESLMEWAGITENELK